ncbi:RNA polymerase sigma factor [Clostridium ganghwense]|uniref:RNA polymerase sigma factor n=1 Tax=Clostridium ganghwense TaxID=312089 RepID=A0ABT4CT40_9CLOT|nr:RNA polymerase sigma factor [Clostridium ganghwense]MCY6372093.1 RNA polymerase sigma factor [Clostridium ganghwense]
MNIFNFKLNKKQKNFEKLLIPQLNKLYKISFSYLKDKDKASDALQDTALIAYRKLDTLKDKSKFNSWITSILINRCKELLRRESKLIFEELCEEKKNILTNSKDIYSKIDTSIDILNSLEELDEKYRDVITLKYFGDYSIKEIATILKIPEGTVKSRINFGIKKLNNIMSDGEVAYNEL